MVVVRAVGCVLLITAPTTPGVYYVRFGRAQNFRCDHADWWMGTPPAERTIGAICVR